MRSFPNNNSEPQQQKWEVKNKSHSTIKNTHASKKGQINNDNKLGLAQ